MKRLEFKLKYYERTGTYMVQLVGKGYLRYNENTGAVYTDNYANKATYCKSKDVALGLIDYYLKPLPVKEEIYEHFIGDDAS